MKLLFVIRNFKRASSLQRYSYGSPSAYLHTTKSRWADVRTAQYS